MFLTISFFLISIALSSYFGYLIYLSSNGFYYLFSILFVFPLVYLIFFIWCIILFIWSLFLSSKKEIKKPNRFYNRIVLETDYFILFFFRIHVKFKGKEKLPKDQRYLIVNNHISNFDQMVMMKYLKPLPIIFISKEGNFKIPIAGKFIYNAGYIKLNRDDPRVGIKAIKKAISYIEENKASISISPEGTRNKTDSILLPFHPGSFKIATISKAPIVISGIKGTNKVIKRFPWRYTKVEFEILEVLSYDNYKDKTTVEIANYCENIIKKFLLGDKK